MNLLVKIIQKFKKSSLHPTITINFKAEDLQRLDILQNKILGTCDGCQSVCYKTDKQIFELCLEMIERLFKDYTIENTNIDIKTKFENIKEINRFMKVYFSYYLENKLI